MVKPENWRHYVCNDFEKDDTTEHIGIEACEKSYQHMSPNFRSEALPLGYAGLEAAPGEEEWEWRT